MDITKHPPCTPKCPRGAFGLLFGLQAVRRMEAADGTDFTAAQEGKGSRSGCERAEAGAQRVAAAAGLEEHRRREMTKYYEYEGEALDLKAISEKTGVPLESLRKRLRSGMSVSESIEAIQSLRGKRYEYRGQMLTVRELSWQRGISVGLINYRLRNGWNVEAAAEEPPGLQRRAAAARKRAHKPEKPTTPQQERWNAAYAICRTIAWDPEAFNFRCTEPMIEYTFESDILGYNIRFISPDRAQLTAYWRKDNVPSDLNRLYDVDGEKIKEVQPT